MDAAEVPAPFLAGASNLGRRPGSYTTRLIHDGAANAIVVAPTSSDGRAAAVRLADAMAQRTGVALPVRGVAEVIRGRCRGPAKELRRRPLILLGDINTNEAIVPLYARFLCFADAEYPGTGGYALRTIRNPWGTLANVLLIAASDGEGLTRGIDAFLRLPQLKTKAGEASCGFVLEAAATLQPDVQRSLTKLARSASQYAASAEKDAQKLLDLSRQVYPYPMAYLLTGDARFAKALSVYAKNVTAEIAPTFAVGDYSLEAYARLLQVLTNLNILDAETVQRLDANAILSLYKLRNSYWLVTVPGRIGSRHQMSGTIAYLMICTDLYHNLPPDTDEAVRGFIEKQYRGTYSHYRYITQNSFSGSTDSNATQTNMTSLFQFALGYGETEGFVKGLAMEGIKKMVATVDSLGHGVGAGTYEDAYPEGATKVNYANGAPLRFGAFYFCDGHPRWLFQNRAGLGWGSWFGRSPFGLHQYATGEHLEPEQPGPELETMWVRPRPVYAAKYEATDEFPRNRLFDKAVIRVGASADDAYFCFQGFGSGDAMALLRYVDRGQLWLATNCQLADKYWRNSLVVSDGFGGTAGDCSPRLDVCQANGRYAFFSATLRGVRGGQWNRWLIHRVGGFSVFADTFTAGKDGDYALAVTFKTPAPASLDGHVLAADKAGWRFRIQGPPDTVPSVDHGVRRMDAQRFWYLREVRNQALKEGESSTIANLLVVRDRDCGTWPKHHELSTNAIVVEDGDTTILLVRGPLRDDRIETDAKLVAVEADRAVCAGGTFLAIDGRRHHAKAKQDGIFEVEHDFRGCLDEALKRATRNEGKPPEPGRPFGFASVRNLPRKFGMTPAPIRGYRVSPTPAERPHKLDDNVVKMWDRGAILVKQEPLTVSFGQPVTLRRIDVCTGSGKSNGVVRQGKPVDVRAEGATEYPPKNWRPLKLSAAYVPDLRELYKMRVWQVARTVCDLPPTRLRCLRLTGLPEKVCELTFYNDESVPSRIRRIEPVHLDGDGTEELLVETLNREITALDLAGNRLFAVKLPYDIINFVADDLDGDGKADLVVACFDLRLHKFDYQGQTLMESEPLFQHPYTINSARRPDSERRALALTYYYHAQFLDDEFQPLCEPVRVGAMWLETAAVFDVDGDEVDDILTVDIYGRGHCVGGASFKDSGLYWAPSGIGAGLWPWSPIQNRARSVLFVGTSSIGARTVSPLEVIDGRGDWSLSDGSVFTDAAVVDLDGDGVEELIATKAVGHAVVVDHSGKVLRTIACEGVLHCVETIVADKRALLLVGTSLGLRVFDHRFREVAFLPGDVTHLAVSGTTVWAVVGDSLCLLGMASQ